MKVIGKTSSGLLIDADPKEVRNILNTLGRTDEGDYNKKKDLDLIGIEFSANDYAAKIAELKNLATNSDLNYVRSHYDKLGVQLAALERSVGKNQKT